MHGLLSTFLVLVSIMLAVLNEGAAAKKNFPDQLAQRAPTTKGDRVRSMLNDATMNAGQRMGLSQALR